MKICCSQLPVYPLAFFNMAVSRINLAGIFLAPKATVTLSIRLETNAQLRGILFVAFLIGVMTACGETSQGIPGRNGRDMNNQTRTC
jgi:hypothetical protein